MIQYFIAAFIKCLKSKYFFADLQQLQIQIFCFMLLNDHYLVEQTISLVNDNFQQPIDTQYMVTQHNYPMVPTSEKALQFKQDIVSMDEMLQETNTINFEELHSESQRTERTHNTMVQQTNGGHINNSSMKHQYLLQAAQAHSNEQFRQTELQSFDNEQRRKSSSKKYQNSNVKINNQDAQTFDFDQVRRSKQVNIQQAFQENLKAKKQEIIELESKYIQLTQSQTVKLAKLGQLTKQREFYQQQYNFACIKRKTEMDKIKDQLKKIDHKIRDYNAMHLQTESEISIKQDQENAELTALVYRKNELNLQIKKMLLGSTDYNDQNEILTDYQEIQKTTDEQHELSYTIKMNEELIKQLKVKKLEVKEYITKLGDFIRQASEEYQMTQEDIDTKNWLKAELIASREELDQMYEMGRTQAGKEFLLFLKLQEVKQVTGDENPKFVEQQYEQVKAHTFFNNIVNQMRAHPRAQESEIMQKIEEAQQQVKEKVGILQTSEMIQIISNLTNELDMQINEALLLEKYKASSREKDKIFTQKSQKLSEIQNEINEFENCIHKYHNSISNILNPQMIANEQTISENRGKLEQLQNQERILEDKLESSKEDLKNALSQNEKSHHRNLSRQSINALKAKVNELQILIQSKEQKLAKMNTDRNNLQTQFDKSLQILKDKRNDLISKLKIFDSYASSLNSSKTSIKVTYQPNDEQRQDEQIRQVLDSIDLKIGQSIEEKEQECLQMQLMQKQIQEAKNCFTNAYKHYKAIKKEVDAEFANSNSLNKLNNQIIGKEDLSKSIPDGVFSSEKKNHTSTFDQYISFSQNSKTANVIPDDYKDESAEKLSQSLIYSQAASTPFKNIDKINENNQFLCFTPQEDSHAKVGPLCNNINKENQLKKQKSKSSQKKLNNSAIYLYFNEKEPAVAIDPRSTRLSDILNDSSMLPENYYINNHQSAQKVVPTQPLVNSKKVNGQHPSSHITIDVFNSEKTNIISKSPHIKSSNRILNSKSQVKERCLSQQKRLLKYSKFKTKNVTVHSSSVKKNKIELESKGSGSLIYDENYMNEIFTNDKDVQNAYGTQNIQPHRPIIHPFQLDQVNEQQQDHVTQDRMSDLNNDLNDVWGSSQQSVINQTPMQPMTLNKKAFNYQEYPTDDKRSNGFIMNFLSEIKQKAAENNKNQQVVTQNIETQNTQSNGAPPQLFAQNANKRNQKHRQFSMETAGFQINEPTSNTPTNRSAISVQKQISDAQQPQNDSSLIYGQPSKNVTINLADLQNTNNLMDLSHPMTTVSNSNTADVSCSTRYDIQSSAPMRRSSTSMSQQMQQQRRSLKQQDQMNLHLQGNQGNLGNIIQSIKTYSKLKQTSQPQGSNVKTTSRSNQVQRQEMQPQQSNKYRTIDSQVDQMNQSYHDQPMIQQRQSKEQHQFQENPHSQSVNNNFNIRQNLSHNDLFAHLNLPRPNTQLSNHNHSKLDKSPVDYSNASSLPIEIHHASTPSRLDKRSSVMTESRLCWRAICLGTLNANINRRPLESTLTQNTNSIVQLPSPNSRLNLQNKRNELLPALLPLLQGAIFYKKFSQRQCLKPTEKSFDPLRADKTPPEQCGYGIRFIQLDTSLKYVNIRQHLKNSIEVQIPIYDILKPIIPSITMEIIKAKKSASSPTEPKRSQSQFDDYSNKKQTNLIDSLTKEHKNTQISHLIKIGVIDKNSQAFKNRCADCMYFPFSIALKKQISLQSSDHQQSSSNRIHLAGSDYQSDTVDKKRLAFLRIIAKDTGYATPSKSKDRNDGRIELIATSYESLKAWTLGINMLLQQLEATPKSQQ